MSDDLVKQAVILRCEPGDILCIEVEEGREVDNLGEVLKIFEDRGIAVLVHDSRVREFRIARKAR